MGFISCIGTEGQLDQLLFVPSFNILPYSCILFAFLNPKGSANALPTPPPPKSILHSAEFGIKFTATH